MNDCCILLFAAFREGVRVGLDAMMISGVMKIFTLRGPTWSFYIMPTNVLYLIMVHSDQEARRVSLNNPQLATIVRPRPRRIVAVLSRPGLQDIHPRLLLRYEPIDGILIRTPLV